MEKYSWEYFDDVFGTNSLGTDIVPSNAEKQSGRIEITINYPRDKRFISYTDEKRKELYKMLFEGTERYLLHSHKFETRSEYTFEPSNIGLHLHGYIDFQTDKKGSFYGLLEMLCRFILSQIPPGKSRINTWEKGKIFDNFPRFECPALCMNIRASTEIERAKYWEQYINKMA
jgi:hypothetical protein